jgi:hypothetical protein
MTAAEKARLGQCETIIKRGIGTFLEVGSALAEIRESRLYRDTHQSFAVYCRDRWTMGKSHAYRLIDASAIVSQTSPMGDFPVTERAVREIPKGTDPVEAAEIIQEASERTNGKPTAKAIREVVAERAAPSPNGAHPEPEDDSPDPVAEWERAEKEVERLEELLAMLKTTDVAKDLTALSGKYGQLEGRLRQEMTTRSEAEKEARYAKGELAKIRKALHVERDRDILPAIEALR